MKSKRKAAPGRMAAQVISLDVYRRARDAPAPAPAPLEHDSLMVAYCRWLALAGAVWTFWW